MGAGKKGSESDRTEEEGEKGRLKIEKQTQSRRKANEQISFCPNECEEWGDTPPPPPPNGDGEAKRKEGSTVGPKKRARAGEREPINAA